MMLFENCHIVPLFQDQTGAAIASDWISMRKYNKCLILAHEMRGASAVATVYRLDVGTDVIETSTGTISLKDFWYIQDVTSTTGDLGVAAVAVNSDTWTKGTAAATWSSSTTQSKGQWLAIEVAAQDLGSAYTALQLQIVSSNAAHYISAWAILYEARYAEDLTPTAIVD